MRITYIGHATLLIEIGGKTFLTDPNFDSSLGMLLPRVSAPGIPLHGLPEIDAVFVTHAHADHLSFASLAGLRKGVPIYAPPAVAKRQSRAAIILPAATPKLTPAAPINPTAIVRHRITSRTETAPSPGWSGCDAPRKP